MGCDAAAGTGRYNSRRGSPRPFHPGASVRFIPVSSAEKNESRRASFPERLFVREASAWETWGAARRRAPRGYR